MNIVQGPISSQSRLLVLGHRGAVFECAPFYQNSLRAFEEAVTTADGFETDACADKDGEIFLIHEAKYVDPAKGVEYCAGEHLDAASIALIGDRRIDQLTSDEMRRLRLKDGTPIPTLKQAIELTGKTPGKLLNIELKGYDVAGPVLRLLKQSLHDGVITPEALLVSSFNHPALEIVRREMPELSVGAIFIGDEQPTKPLFPWQPGSSGAYTALTPEVLNDPLLQRIRPEVFVMPEEILTEATVALIGARFPKARVAAWIFTEKGNVDLPDLLQRLEVLRPTGKLAAMIVDNPREFAKALHRAG